MSFSYKRQTDDEAELDITSFMNLMIVLVPVLLLSLTFTQITVHEIKLPDLQESNQTSEVNPPKLEVLLSPESIKIYYPSDQLIQNIAKIEQAGESVHDFDRLSLVLQQIKSQRSEKRDLLLLSDNTIDYQNLVAAMDAIKSYKTVIAASVVEIELFPEISLANASIK